MHAKASGKVHFVNYFRLASCERAPVDFSRKCEHNSKRSLECVDSQYGNNKQKNDPYFCVTKASGKVHFVNYFRPTLCCKQTSVLVENALPKVALLSLANQTSQMLLLVFLDDCHSLFFASSLPESAQNRPPIQICSANLKLCENPQIPKP